MSGKQPTARSLITGIILVCLAQPAAAQIEQVIVTATKRPLDRQSVPLTLQAIDADELRELNADTAEDLLLLFPNLSINGSNEVNKGFTIRGVGTNNFHGNVNSAVGVYQDEVSMSTPFSGVLGVYDIERVEILRGPQNALFGRNTTGGAVNYISRAPEVGSGWSGYAHGALGQDSQADLEAAVGFDTGRRSAARLALQSVGRDGLFINRVPGREGERLGERDRLSARAQWTWQPTATTRVLLNAHAGYHRGSNVGNKAIGLRDPRDPSQPCDPDEIAAGSDYRTRNACAAANGFNPSSSEWETVYNNSGAQSDIDVEGGYFKLMHEFDAGYELTSITAFENTRVNQADDSSGFNQQRLTPMQDGDYHQFSHEMRLASGPDEALRWLAGVLYFEEDMVLGTNVMNGGAGVVASNILDQTDRDLSVYGQVEIDLLDRLGLGIGLRYTDNEKRAPSSIFRIVPQGPNGLADPTIFLSNDLIESAGVVARTIALRDLKAELNELGGKVHVSWQAVDDVFVYGSYSRGFKAGGFDTRAIAALVPGSGVGTPVGAETLDAWELGIKSTLANGALLLNAAVFSYDWKDLQSFVVVNGVPGFANIPESDLHGLEIEAQWSPAASWLLTASAGFLDTEVADAGNLTSSIDEGHELTNAPEFSATASIRKEFELPSGRLVLRADAAYAGEQRDTFRFALDRFSTKGSTLFLNLRGTWHFGPDERFDIALWGENLTEERTCFDIGLVDNPSMTMGQLSTTGACSPSEGQRRFGISGGARF